MHFIGLGILTGNVDLPFTQKNRKRFTSWSAEGASLMMSRLLVWFTVNEDSIGPLSIDLTCAAIATIFTKVKLKACLDFRKERLFHGTKTCQERIIYKMLTREVYYLKIFL